MSTRGDFKHFRTDKLGWDRKVESRFIHFIHAFMGDMWFGGRVAIGRVKRESEV